MFWRRQAAPARRARQRPTTRFDFIVTAGVRDGERAPVCAAAIC